MALTDLLLLLVLDRTDKTTELIAHGLGCHTSRRSLKIDVARASDAGGDRVARGQEGGHRATR